MLCLVSEKEIELYQNDLIFCDPDDSITTVPHPPHTNEMLRSAMVALGPDIEISSSTSLTKVFAFHWLRVLIVFARAKKACLNEG